MSTVTDAGTSRQRRVRLAVDIGGTFTDIALEFGGQFATGKVLTTTGSPELGVLEGIEAVLDEAELRVSQVELIIHGTTLGTNAIIERKGARTALIVTEGFRDSVEMAYENRFDQYDIAMHKPSPLVPRDLRWSVPERVAADGEILVPLDEASVHGLLESIDRERIQSIAVALLHSYREPVHERRVGEILRAARPDLSVTLSSDVCPEIREYERMSTACANAYIQPLMARYLTQLDRKLKARGFACPLLLMMSSGGLTTLDTSVRFPVRLVESGPAGGAILAGRVAREMEAAEVLSFDMGGTTAKVCLIDDGHPQMARVFEVDRAYRFTKGSGLPVRIPVIEMVEIGAGGGSIARVDTLDRINVGPDSAGSEPGPACYGRGGTDATVTDADLCLGRISAAGFAGGSVTLAPERAAVALDLHVGKRLGLDTTMSAFGVAEIVDENMANAARVHAVELGKDVSRRTLVAFGGGGPLHAARLAEKLSIDTVVVPTAAGVGSAVGFLLAPVSYEVVRSHYVRLAELDTSAVGKMLDDMGSQARAVVALATDPDSVVETRTVFMRYCGQGHEIAVTLPAGRLDGEQRTVLRKRFESVYASLYTRKIPGAAIEALTWVVNLSTAPPPIDPRAATVEHSAETEEGREVFDSHTLQMQRVPVYRRAYLERGAFLSGPALISEPQTTTFVSPLFNARVDSHGYLVLERKKEAGR